MERKNIKSNRMLHRFGLRFSDLFITLIIALQNRKSNTGKSNTEIKVDTKNSEMKEIFIFLHVKGLSTHIFWKKTVLPHCTNFYVMSFNKVKAF